MSANPGPEPVKTDTLLFINGEHRRGRAGQLAVTDPGSGRDAGTVQLADRPTSRMPSTPRPARSPPGAAQCLPSAVRY